MLAQAPSTAQTRCSRCRTTSTPGGQYRPGGAPGWPRPSGNRKPPSRPPTRPRRWPMPTARLHLWHRGTVAGQQRRAQSAQRSYAPQYARNPISVRVLGGVTHRQTVAAAGSRRLGRRYGGGYGGLGRGRSLGRPTSYGGSSNSSSRSYGGGRFSFPPSSVSVRVCTATRRRVYKPGRSVLIQGDHRGVVIRPTMPVMVELGTPAETNRAGWRHRAELTGSFEPPRPVAASAHRVNWIKLCLVRRRRA